MTPCESSNLACGQPMTWFKSTLAEFMPFIARFKELFHRWQVNSQQADLFGLLFHRWSPWSAWLITTFSCRNSCNNCPLSHQLRKLSFGLHMDFSTVTLEDALNQALLYKWIYALVNSFNSFIGIRHYIYATSIAQFSPSTNWNFDLENFTCTYLLQLDFSTVTLQNASTQARLYSFLHCSVQLRHYINATGIAQFSSSTNSSHHPSLWCSAPVVTSWAILHFSITNTITKNYE